MALKKAKENPSKKRAVVAEDDVELRFLIASTLDELGLEVAAVEDGEKLMRLIEQCAARITAAPQVIITDIHMPICSGFQVLGAMRRLGVNIPTIVITAFGDSRTHALVKELGAVASFDKPLDVRDLCDEVLRLTGQA